ncbi:MAG: CPBP family intramembrane metalloprotease [Ilumatobacter sp.]|nr:CPBP family intramembrane metalloprotease [Ilumatobacter sp.]
MTSLPPPPGPPPPVSPARWAPPVPGPAGRPRPTFAPPRQPHPTLPISAAGGALAVLIGSLFGSKVLLDAVLRYEWPVVAYVALLGVVGYAPSLMWCTYVSRRWGSGAFLADVGIVPRWSDLGWGPVAWLAAVGTQVFVGALVLAFDVPLTSNTDGISELTQDRTYVVSIVITAVVAAPFVEEVVFRGVVMRGLLSRLPVLPTIGLQAVLFGVAHIDPVRGVGNIGLALVLTGVGAAFGGAAYLLRRIGPTIVAHAIFNGVVLLLVLTRVAERLQD